MSSAKHRKRFEPFSGEMIFFNFSDFFSNLNRKKIRVFLTGFHWTKKITLICWRFELTIRVPPGHQDSGKFYGNVKSLVFLPYFYQIYFYHVIFPTQKC